MTTAQQLRLPKSRADEMREAFEVFDQANPKVWLLFKHFTFAAIAAGHQHFSADLVIARVRWKASVITEGADGFKCNDHYVAFYARKFMAEFPQYHGFFRTRSRPSIDRMARGRPFYADQGRGQPW